MKKGMKKGGTGTENDCPKTNAKLQLHMRVNESLCEECPKHAMIAS